MSWSFPGHSLSLVDTGLEELPSAILGAPADPAATALPSTVLATIYPLSSFPGASQPTPRSLCRIFTYRILDLLHDSGASGHMYIRSGPTFDPATRLDRNLTVKRTLSRFRCANGPLHDKRECCVSSLDSPVAKIIPRGPPPCPTDSGSTMVDE